MLACQNGRTQIVELLLKKRVDPNVQNQQGWNALMFACADGHTQIVELLLKNKVDLKKQTDRGVDAFMIACGKGHIQIVQLLLKQQIDINISSYNGFTPLISACYIDDDNSELIELLLKEGADPNIQIKSGNNPGGNALMAASRLGHIQKVRALLKYNADCNLKYAETGATALLCAVEFAHHKVAQKLIEAGANISDTFVTTVGQTTINYTVTQYCTLTLIIKDLLRTPHFKEMVQSAIQIQSQTGSTVENEDSGNETTFGKQMQQSQSKILMQLQAIFQNEIIKQLRKSDRNSDQIFEAINKWLS